MQNPPPGPPPGGQPPSYPSATGGIDKKTGAILSYLLWWITGIVFLFVGKNDPDVKYHAAQSIVFFGSITALGIVINILSALTPSGIDIILGLINFVVWVFGVVIWVICLIRANSTGGQRFEIPLVGGVVSPYAEQLAAAIH